MPWTRKIEACPTCGFERQVQTCKSGRPCKRCHNRRISRRGIMSNLFKHGLHKSYLFNSWSGMRQRCLNPNNHAYKDYGGRGITVCARWLDNFPNFVEDVGERPTILHSLDRIDNDGNYTPDNCRWATKKEQAANRRARKPWTVWDRFNSIIAKCEGTVS